MMETAPQHNTRPPAGRGLVIIVDDSEICRDIAMMMLEEQGFEVVSLADPKSLPDALGATQPRLVLIDVTMPGISGETLIDRVRKDIGPHCPLVLYSDLKEDELLRLVGSCGASGFIRKTANQDRFRKDIHRFLDG